MRKFLVSLGFGYMLFAFGSYGCSQLENVCPDQMAEIRENVESSVGEIQNGIREAAEGAGEQLALIQELPAGTQTPTFTYELIPEYTENASVEINGNVPFFTEEEKTAWTVGTEYYSPLDELGRCGTAHACIGSETMPAEGETRGEIGMIKPAGWHTVKYPDVIADFWLYNRCHMIAFSLAGENANEKNLITGTRYLNVEGMLPYENAIADYVHATGNHVWYRVTPWFEGSELICRGILMEAESVEDDALRFCVWCYNVQPGIGIDYQTGDSWEEGNPVQADAQDVREEEVRTYVINTNSGKVHLPECSSVASMAEHNRREFSGTVGELIEEGYEPCKVCNPW